MAFYIGFNTIFFTSLFRKLLEKGRSRWRKRFIHVKQSFPALKSSSILIRATYPSVRPKNLKSSKNPENRKYCRLLRAWETAGKQKRFSQRTLLKDHAPSCLQTRCLNDARKA